MIKTLGFNSSGLIGKILFTLGILVFYRIGSFIPVPFIDASMLSILSDKITGGVFGMFDMLSGGSLSRMSVFALGIVPYITSSIIIQLLIVSFDSLKALKQEGEAGQVKINQYTRYLCFGIAFMQGFAIASTLGAGNMYLGLEKYGTFYQKIVVSLTLATGTFLLLWLGERVTAKGIGNGASLIIFTGIVTEFPKIFISFFELARTGSISPFIAILFLVIFLGSIAFVIFAEKSYRIIKIQHHGRNMMMGNNKGQGMLNELPLKINPPGVIPPIFASSLLLLPTTLLSFLGTGEAGLLERIVFMFSHGKPLFIISYVALIIFFTFFYTEIVFNIKEIADNFRKSNYFIHGIRPGESTVNYLRSTMKKLCFIGGSYISIVCVIPELFSSTYGQSFIIGGTSVLIIVNVITDTISQVQSYLLSSKYSKFMQKVKK
jgi:preprotein translocase subunit SecY